MRFSRRLLTLLLCVAIAGSLLVPVSGRRGEAQVDPAYRYQMSRFTEAFNLIILTYVDPVNLKTLVDGAITGMLEALGDPNAQYFSPEELLGFVESLEGTYGGIGMSITTEQGAPVVLHVFPDTPAERAGLRPGDILLEADGESLIGVPLDHVSQKLRGEPGTTVILTVKRPDLPQPFSVRLVRELIRLKTVETRILEPGIGYVRITSFQARTADEVRQAIQSMREARVRGLILDLRDNLGGYLDQSIEVASQFVPEGPIVRISRGEGSTEFLHGHGPGPGFDLVVLVNGRTASAAEIVAGAIQDYGTGAIVGTRTYGKGTIQTIYPLSDNGGLKLTTARYLTPQGRSIQGKGIEPDHVVAAVFDPASLPVVTIQLLQYERTLKPGMVGLDVLALQRRLGQLGLFAGPEDGVFTDATLRAVMEFQASAGLPVSGEVEERTVDALNLARTPRPDTPPPPDNQLERALEVLKERMNRWIIQR